MPTDKKKLLAIAQKVTRNREISPEQIDFLLSFQKVDKEPSSLQVLKRLAVPLSLLLGFLLTVFSQYFQELSSSLPAWTYFSPQLLSGVNYLWDLLGEPVKNPNILYHIPNIVLYTFGIIGIKKLFDLLDKHTWLDKILAAQTLLRENVQNGKLNLSMAKGHSLLFVGKGDFIGMQFTLNQKPAETVTISQTKPVYTSIWNFYDVDTLFEDLKNVLVRSDTESCGEYVFFPVKDDQIFLPDEKSYDLSPHKLDLLCQDIRTTEKLMKWKTKRIIMIGDKFHKSYVHSEDELKPIKNTADVISLTSIAAKYPKVTLLDPSDIVIRKIIEIAQGRKIVFRATKEGIKEYKKRFYSRLKQLGYKQLKKQEGILTIGYDIFEDQTEQQTLSRKIDDYYPVVLSKNVRDALVRNGYKPSEFLYVPELVLQTLSKAASQQ